MRSKFTCVQIQRSVLAVEQISIPIKDLIENGIDRFGILHHRLTVLSVLKFFYPFNVPFPGILILDLDCENVQFISQPLRQFHHRKVALVRFPYCPIIYIPDSPVRIETGYRLVVISKCVPDADFLSAVTRIDMRLHFLKRQSDFGDVRTEGSALFLCCLTQLIRVIQIVELFISGGSIMHRDINRGVSRYHIANGDLPVGRITGPSIPFLSHKARCAEDAVDLFLHIATPEGQHRNQCHVGIGLAIIAIFPTSFVKGKKFLSGLALGCVGYHLVIIEVRAGLHRRISDLVPSLHEGIQYRLQRLVIPGDGALSEHIAGYGHKAVRRAGQIHFKAVPAIIDVVYGLVIGKIRRQTEKTAQTGARGRPFKICIRKDAQDGSCYIIETSVLPDAVVYVDCADTLADAIANAVPAAQGIGLHGGSEVREGGRVVHLRHRAGDRIIRDLGFGAVPLFGTPYAEGGISLQLLRYVHEIHLDGGSVCLTHEIPFLPSS